MDRSYPIRKVICQARWSKIQDINPNLLLLDQRLFRDDQNVDSIHVHRMGGALILQEVRKRNLGILVLLTTASNKVWTFHELLKLGADGYWVKEGMDDYRSSKEQIENYHRFLQLLHSFMAPAYRDLKMFADQLISLRQQPATSLWWTHFNWILHKPWLPEEVPVNLWEEKKSVVLRILEDTLMMLRRDLHQNLLGYGFNPFKEQPWFTPSQAIQNLAKIVEAIHEINKDNRSRGTLIGKVRADEQGYALFQYRHDASHYFAAQYLNWEKDLRDFFQTLFSYLDSAPPQPEYPITASFGNADVEMIDATHYYLNFKENQVKLKAPRIPGSDLERVLSICLANDNPYIVRSYLEITPSNHTYYFCRALPSVRQKKNKARNS
ncbi:MAG: hypothetical protein IPJ40_24350 [Saprospirales bacterium]|nr:hypothetical protein [Saprospirales bacterium]